MERRNRSLKALREIKYLTTLDTELRIKSLMIWIDKYLKDSSIHNLQLEVEQLKELSELFYNNIDFLKEHNKHIVSEINSNSKIKKFFT